ncbi:MAG TPA: sigma-70 family RNA polymerase sigma factor [Actinomycetes bacterium]|jgi:RNA polymerase sigma-70 factor (ECF subfamily)|nr:sigma-70 family RNA polymerase sigma factor [Actinomycetes bacterium]
MTAAGGQAPPGGREASAIAVATGGDAAAFTSLLEPHRRELHVHCYRMVGSFADAEDLVQETFLRAWRKRTSFQGRSTFRAWLYGIATNACLEELRRSQRRLLPHQVTPGNTTPDAAPPVTDVAWIQPYPDRLLDQVAPSDVEPDAVVVAKETIELAFLAAIQLLPPRQRAVLILRDVLRWSASQTASALDFSVPAVNSALQRARATLREHRPDRLDMAPASQSTRTEQALLRRYLDAHERADVAAVVDLLREDVRFAMPPAHWWLDGRDAVAAAYQQGFRAGDPTDWRRVPTRANRQPALACYRRLPGQSRFQAFTIEVLRIQDDALAEITSFGDADLFPAFGLPPAL